MKNVEYVNQEKVGKASIAIIKAMENYACSGADDAREVCEELGKIVVKMTNQLTLENHMRFLNYMFEKMQKYCVSTD